MPISKVTTSSIDALGYGFKNRILNGDMKIDQRNAGAPSSSSISGYLLDRWFVAQTVTGKLIAQQNAGSVTPPTGFSNYLGVTSQSAYSVGAGDFYVIGQPIEANNVTDFAWGTASAASVTLSFKVYSSLTGTFGGVVKNYAGTRSYPFTYTVSSANTWTSVSVTVAGDTSGTWVTSGTGGSIYVQFGLGVGSTYAGAAGAWASANYQGATGATSVVGTNGATFYITGVQLEKGSTATAYDYRPYGTELALCQRYYCKSSSINVVATNGASHSTAGMYSSMIAGAYSTAAAYMPFISFPVSMRAEPSSITIFNTNLPSPSTSGQWSIYNGSTWYNASVSGQSITTSGWGPALTGGWGATGGLPVYGAWTATAEL